jgi:hypothetical protein
MARLLIGVSSQSTNMIVMTTGSKVKLLYLIKPTPRMAFTELEIQLQSFFTIVERPDILTPLNEPLFQLDKRLGGVLERNENGGVLKCPSLRGIEP